jgi:hypothetical protein
MKARSKRVHFLPIGLHFNDVLDAKEIEAAIDRATADQLRRDYEKMRLKMDTDPNCTAEELIDYMKFTRPKVNV